jgi:hypothetical protein
MPEETAALFAELLEKLVDIVGQAAIESLDCIVVVDPGDVADTANRLISATGDLGRYASSPTHPASRNLTARISRRVPLRHRARSNVPGTIGTHI